MLEFVLALLTTSVVMVPVLAVLRRHRVVDVPNARSSHVAVVPRGGGLALLVGVAVGVGSALVVRPRAATSPDLSVVTAVAVGVALFGMLGLVDDLSGADPHVRLVLQVLLAVGMATTVAVAMPSPWGTGLVAVVGSIWLVSYVNAFNFMDGINAISAVSALLAACWFGGLAAHASDAVVYAASWALAGASVGFLPWNAPRSRVFLGDVGSYGVGALIGSLALLTALREGSVWAALAPLAIYLVDTGGTLVRRAALGESLLQAHRSHVYQRLLDRGLSHPLVAGLVAFAGVLICLAGLVLPTTVAVGFAVLIGAVYLALPRLFGQRVHEVIS